MKPKLLMVLFFLTVFFIQDAMAQEVSTVLKNKDKRKMLYASIINNDEMFNEFMLELKASGRTEDGIQALNGHNGVSYEKMANAEVEESSEDAMMCDKMMSMMQEMIEENPEMGAKMQENHPEIAEMMQKHEEKKNKIKDKQEE